MQYVTNPVAFLLFIVCRMSLYSFTLCNTPSFFTRSVQQIFSILSSTTIQNLPGISDLLSKVSKFMNHTKLCPRCNILLVSSLNLCPICQRKVFLLKFAFAIQILDLISDVHLASFVIMLNKQLKHSTISRCALNTLFVKEYTRITTMMTMTMTTKMTMTTTTTNDGNVCYMNST
jgi:hypothetical protein